MATDKRLDQVSTLTDFDYALIVKGDQVAKASKQQLAELVGNLLYGATNARSLATVVEGQIGNASESKSGLLSSNVYRRNLQNIQLSQGKVCKLTEFSSGLQSVRIFGINVSSGGYVDLFVRTDINGSDSITKIHDNEALKVVVVNSQVALTVINGVFNLQFTCSNGFYPALTITEA